MEPDTGFHDTGLLRLLAATAQVSTESTLLGSLPNLPARRADRSPVPLESSGSNIHPVQHQFQNYSHFPLGTAQIHANYAAAALAMAEEQTRFLIG